MIDLNTAKRPEFIEYAKNLEDKIKFLEDENHHLNLRLQEYEGIETKDEREEAFQEFWVMYEKKGNLKNSRKRFYSLTKTKRKLAMDKLPAYIKATNKGAVFPSRKNAEVWLNQEGWNDELPERPQSAYTRPEPPRSAAYKIHKAKPISISDINIDDKMKKLRSL